MTREYTQADRRSAIRLYTEKGWGYLKISQAIGCSKTAARDWILNAGIEPRPVAGYPDSFKAKVMSDYEKREDLSLEKIAHKNGVSAPTLSRWLHRSGKMVRPNRPRIVDRDSIIADIKAGLPKAEIAKRNHCSVSWVYQVQRGDG